MILSRGTPRTFPVAGGPRPSPAPVVPYEYAARFELRGVPGNIVQDVIAVNPDGVFVAVAIGYGFLEDRSEPLSFAFEPGTSRVPGSVKLGEVPIPALLGGLRVSPRSENMVFEGSAGTEEGAGGLEYSSEAISVELLDKAFHAMRAPREPSFLFSMVDSSSGRELQDEPVHNVAALGKSSGERPFRPLAQPLRFLPRSTIRMQVVERTPGVRGSLFIVLIGYSALVASACPEPAARAIVAAAAQASAHPGGSDRVVPFDYVAKFTLTGRPRNHLEDEVTVNAEGGFVATDVGYGLAAENEPIRIAETESGNALKEDDDPEIELKDLPLRAFPPPVLRTALRIKPAYTRIAIGPDGILRKVRRKLAEQCFESLNVPEDVAFLYSISDTGAGRDWQNRPIYNVAGLGIANGLRPFKRLARPRVLPPRSTLRISVEECFGRGTLYVVLQGYKLLHAPPPGGRS